MSIVKLAENKALQNHKYWLNTKIKEGNFDNIFNKPRDLPAVVEAEPENQEKKFKLFHLTNKAVFIFRCITLQSLGHAKKVCRIGFEVSSLGSLSIDIYDNEGCFINIKNIIEGGDLADINLCIISVISMFMNPYDVTTEYLKIEDNKLFIASHAPVYDESLKFTYTFINDYEKILTEYIDNNSLSEVGYIYFLSDTENNRVKIGRSKHPKKRCKQIATQSGLDISIIFSVPFCGDLEKTAHRYFEDQHLCYEWFKREGNLADFIRLNYEKDFSNLVTLTSFRDYFAK